MKYVKFALSVLFFITLSSSLVVANDMQIRKIDSLTVYCRTITYSDPVLAMDVIEEIIAQSQNEGYSRGIGDGYNLRGILYFNWGLYDMALRDFTMALHAFSQANDNAGLSRALNNLGVLSSTIMQYKLSLACFSASLSIQIHYQKWENVVDLYNNIGSMYERLKDTASARKYALKSIRLSKNINYPLGIATAYNNLAVVDENIGDYQHAFVLYLQSLSYKEFIPRHQLCLTYSNLGRLEFINGRPDMAIKWLDSSAAYGEIDQDQQLLKALYEQYANVYASKKDYANAYRYLRKHVNLIIALNEQNVGRDFAHFVFAVQREQWNSERKLLGEKMQIQRRFQIVLVIGLLILLILIAMGIILFRIRIRILHQKRRFAELERESLQNEIKNSETISRLEKEKLEVELSYRNRQLTSLSLNIVAKNETLQDIGRNLDILLDNNNELRSTDSYSRLNSILKMSSDDDAIWKSFFHHFEEVYPGFFAKLSKEFPQLTHNDLRLSAFIHINMGNKEIARILGISEASIKIKKNRLGKKLGLDSAHLLPKFMQSIIQ